MNDVVKAWRGLQEKILWDLEQLSLHASCVKTGEQKSKIDSANERRQQTQLLENELRF